MTFEPNKIGNKTSNSQEFYVHGYIRKCGSTFLFFYCYYYYYYYLLLECNQIEFLYTRCFYI